MIPSGFELFGLNAVFQRGFAFKQVDGHMPDDTEIFRGLAFTDPAVVFAESDVQAPVQSVFDTPVFTDGFGDSRGVVCEAGDEVSGFRRGVLVEFALSCDHRDGFHSRPQMFSGKPVDVTGDEIVSGFDATVVAVNCFQSIEGAIGGVLEKQGDILMEPFLVVF